MPDNSHPSDVYCDLRKKCASVKALHGPHKGRVVAKPRHVVVRNVAFRVLPGGLATARRDGVRNVHAYARGEVGSLDVPADVEAVKLDARARRLHYNPFKADTFVDGDGRAVHAAAVLAIEGKTAYFIPEEHA